MRKQADTRPLIHIRLTDKVREDIEKEAENAGRTLTKEVERRLAASVATPEDPTYGWAAPDKAKALADMLGALAADVLDYSAPDPEKDLWTALAMLKIAMVDLLNGTGAAQGLEGDQEATARLIARQYLKDLDRVEANPSAYGQRPYYAKLAAFKKEWLT